MSPLSRFFFSCLLGAALVSLTFLSGCGGLDSESTEDTESPPAQSSPQNLPKTTLPVTCTQCRI